MKIEEEEQGADKKLRHVDGNVPLKDSSSKKEIEHSSSKKGSRSKAACDSKDLCGSKTKKENKKVQTRKRDHFYCASNLYEINEFT